MLIVLFSALNGNAPRCESYGETIRFAQFYTPAIAVMSLVTACYTTIVMGLATPATTGCSSACAARRCRCGSTSARG